MLDRRIRIVVACTLLCALFVGCATQSVRSPGIHRAIWVTRFDWTTAADVERVVADCARAGFGAVLFQVRGNGTVFFDSRHEVFSERFRFASPGFDPLGVAVAAARRHGVELHAWVNVVPGWQGDVPPADPRQLWNARPQWFVADVDGEREPLRKGGYASLNLGLPEVRAHIASLCREIAERYDVDGVHLDRVRFLDDERPLQRGYPLDRRSRELCRSATGRDPVDDPAAFARWKQDAVTATVREVRAALRGVGRVVTLTAAVMPDAATALTRTSQDWPRWTRDGLVDAVLPMNYTDDDALFARRIADAVERSRVPVVAGIGAYKHGASAQTDRQVEAALRAGAVGTAVYSYAKLAEGRGEAR